MYVEDPTVLASIAPTEAGTPCTSAEVAVLALPVNAPTNVVDVTDVRPAKVVTVAPKATFVLPIVTLEFVNDALAMLLNVLEDPLIVLFVRVSAPANVASVPVDGSVTLVVAPSVSVRPNAPEVVKLPPRVIVLPLLLTPVPPYWPVITVPCQTPVPIVPTEVKLEFTTPDPSVLADSTDVPAILNTLLIAKSICSEEVHESVASTQLNVLSVDPFKVMPPPSAVISVGTATLPSSIFLSSTETVVELTVVVVPLTVRSPDITKAPLTLTVPVPASVTVRILAFVKPLTLKKSSAVVTRNLFTVTTPLASAKNLVIFVLSVPIKLCSPEPGIILTSIIVLPL